MYILINTNWFIFFIGLVIDPADPSAVLPHLSKPVEYILNTHHHEYSALLNCSNFGDECTFSDHSGGNFGMKKAFPNALICGFDGRIPALDHKLDNFELLKV